MNTNTIQTIAIVAGSLASLVTAVVYWKLFSIAREQVAATLDAARRQVKIAKRAAAMQTYHAVTNALSVDRDMREARRRLRDAAGQRKWTDEEQEIARRVCAAFNVALVLGDQRALPRKLFLDEYHDALIELQRQLQSAPNGVQAYRSLRAAFDELSPASKPAALTPTAQMVPSLPSPDREVAPQSSDR